MNGIHDDHRPDDVAVQDARRAQEIGRYRVLDLPRRRELQALVEVAAQVAGVPLATISMFTDTEQRHVAQIGFDDEACRREDSMCNLVLHSGRPVIVSDARLDDRFKDNPMVDGRLANVRFYATHQLVTPHGVPIGTLCVFDDAPREISAEQAASLASLAERVVDLLELDLRTRDLTSSLEDLRSTQAELERSNEQLAAFAGQISHDLLNPLTAVSMSLTLLREQLGPTSTGAATSGAATSGAATSGAADRDEMAWLAQRAIGGAQRMQTLIDDLLAFARLGGQLNRDRVDLGTLVDDVREDLAAVLTHARVRVGELPVVTGDRVQLRAVLQNLIANAAKFARTGEHAEIEVSSRRLDSGWRVEIADHGIGIPPADRERVFAPLARVSEEVEGLGIGLATVRRVLDAHGGSIGLEETPGGGTTVWFELPD
ncbi:ATP-binding protein [Nocardioides sp.]|uniref:sensor histidine kinase n=1 Tax=Nocardioides sp. TaxID=35761 RepID=UPI003564D07E